jgi:hypothetical protein
MFLNWSPALPSQFYIICTLHCDTNGPFRVDTRVHLVGFNCNVCDLILCICILDVQVVSFIKWIVAHYTVVLRLTPEARLHFQASPCAMSPTKWQCDRFLSAYLDITFRQQCYYNAPHIFVHPSYSQVAVSLNNTHSTQHSLFCEAR